MLRDEIRKSDDISQTKLFKNLEYLKKFENSFNYVVILLGAFFGFRKFYDQYYERLNLQFYKNFKPPKKEEDKELQEKIETVSEIDETVQAVVEEVSQSEKEQTEPNTEEKVMKPMAVQEQNIKNKIETEEIQPETNSEAQINNLNTQQEGNKELISDESRCQELIEQALEKEQEIKLAAIVTMIKESTGKKVQIKTVENLAKQMSGIEIIKIGKARGIRRSGKLFKQK